MGLEDIKKETLGVAEALESALKVMKTANRPNEIRKAFLQVADIIQRVPGEETLVSHMRRMSEPQALTDDQVVQLRRKMLEDTPAKIQFYRNLAKEMRKERKGSGKKWWEFWK